MADSDKQLLAKGVALYQQGNVAEAISILEVLEKKTTTPQIRIDVLQALVTNLDPYAVKKYLERCEEGLSLAKTLNSPIQKSYFQAKRARGLQFQCINVIHEVQNLVISKGWFQFALESDKARYDDALKLIEQYEKGADRLIDQAISTAHQSGDMGLLGHQYLTKGEMLGERIGTKSILFINKDTKISKLFKLFPSIRRLNLAPAFQKELEVLRDQMTQSYLESARVFKQNGQENDAGYSYYNLAVKLKIDGWKWRKYLNLAERIGKKNNDLRLVKNCRDFRRYRYRGKKDKLEGFR